MSEGNWVFEWDEAKRLATIDKHGIDFMDLGPFFDSEYLLAEAQRRRAMSSRGFWRSAN